MFGLIHEPACFFACKKLLGIVKCLLFGPGQIRGPLCSADVQNPTHLPAINERGLKKMEAESERENKRNKRAQTANEDRGDDATNLN